MNSFYHRGGMWVVGQSLLMLAFLLAPVWARGDWSGAWSAWLGGLLLVISAVFGLGGVAVLGRNRTPFPQPRPGSQLVCHGLYRWVRHPLYTSVICFAFGWSLGWRSWVGVMLAVLTAAFLFAKSKREEQWLRARFPDYETYARRTRRFFPGLF